MTKWVITKYRDQHAQKRQVLNRAYSFEGSEYADWKINQSPHAYHSDALRLIIKEDQQRYLLDSLKSVLSKKELIVFKMRFFDHLSYKEIAARMPIGKKGKSDAKSIDNAICRIVKKIKRFLPKIDWQCGEYIEKISRARRPTTKKDQEYDIDGVGSWGRCVRLFEDENHG